MPDLNIYVHGRDGVGWSIDQDHDHVKRTLQLAGLKLTWNPVRADVVHNVWWNRLLERRAYFLRRKKRLIATVTNELDPASIDFERLSSHVSLWLAASKRQLTRLREAGALAEYQPFIVDDSVFRPLNLDRAEILSRLGIPPIRMGDKRLIGSFQRDTLGADLTTPKWQKGPDVLLDVLDKIEGTNDWLVVLAGPRRHYIIRALTERGIPYVFVGVPPRDGEDDVHRNTLSPEKMALLYNLVDIYVVTSRSEGGPKAVLEAPFCGTPVLSTRVGMAVDALPDAWLCENGVVMAERLSSILSSPENSNAVTVRQQMLNNYSMAAATSRWRTIYAKLEAEYPL